MPKSLAELVNEADDLSPEGQNTNTQQDSPESLATDGVGTDAPATGSFRGFLSENKFDVPDGIDENTLQRQIAERLREASSQEAQIAQLKQQLAEAGNAAPPEPAVPVPAPVTPAEAAAVEQSIWEQTYSFEPAQVALTTRNENGWFEPRDNSQDAREAADKLNQGIEIGNKRLQQFASNPAQYAEYLKESILKDIEGKIKAPEVDLDALVARATQTVQEQQLAARREQEIDGWYDAHQSQLFKVDANGQPLTDPLTSRYIKTDVGIRFQDAMQTLTENGVADEQKAIEMAWKWVAPNGESPATPAAPAAQRTPQQQRDRFLDREAPLPEPATNGQPGGRPQPTHSPPSLAQLIAEQKQNI